MLADQQFWGRAGLTNITEAHGERRLRATEKCLYPGKIKVNKIVG